MADQVKVSMGLEIKTDPIIGSLPSGPSCHKSGLTARLYSYCMSVP